MISSFKQYLVEENKTAYFSFGRMNPPTIGHGKLLDKLATSSGKNPYFMYLSKTEDAKKNPLSYSDKIKHVRKMFPKHAREIIASQKVNTVFDALVELYNKGFNKVVMVVGSDRVREFEILLNKFNGIKSRHGFYNFESIKIISAGARDPDAEGVEGMSASKQRENAKENDFVSFSQGLPNSMNNKDARKLFNDVRKGMGLKEENSFKNHISLDSISETREKYVQGELFQLGESVIVKETDEVGEITWLGSNYVVVKLSEGKTVRKWLEDVEHFDEGMFANIDPKLDRLIDRWVNKPAFKKAIRLYLDMRKEKPGKAQQNMVRAAKVVGIDYKNLEQEFHKLIKQGKLPKHLAFRKDLVSEQTDSDVSRAKEKIQREKEADKVKHDRILDTAKKIAARKKKRLTTTSIR